LTKPLDLDVLRLTLERVLDHMRLATENEALRLKLGKAGGATEIIGKSKAMRELFSMIAMVAPTEATVLITGESGTGKELVARALHEGSPRASGPLVAGNCAALSETLLESDLFGHEKAPSPGPSVGGRAGSGRGQGVYLPGRDREVRRSSRPSCCASSRSARSSGWAATGRWVWTCAPGRHQPRPEKRVEAAGFARICTTVSTS
jgi:hypothetical protein